MSPEKTLILMRSGEHQKVFRQLYSVLPGFRRWVRQAGGQPEEAQDCLQEAMLVFFRKCQEPEFILTAKPETYVFAVARRIYMAQNRQQRELRMDEDMAGQIPETHEIADILEKEALYRSLEHSLEALGDKCRELLKRFYYCRESMTSIANALGFRNEHVAKAMKYKCLEKARQGIAAFNPPVYEEQ